LLCEGIEGGLGILFQVTYCHSGLGPSLLSLTQSYWLLYYPGPGVKVFSLTAFSVNRSTLEAKQLLGFMTVIPNFSNPYIERFLADCMLLLI